VPKLVRVCLLSLLAVGCAAPSLTYVEPTQGERARVRLATGTSGVTVVRGYDDSGCRTNEKAWMRLIRGQNPLIESSPRKLGLPGWYHHENAAKEIYVEASREQTLMFIGTETSGNTLHRCGVPLTFRFEKDRDYEVSYHLGPPNCSVTVYQLNAKEPVRTVLRTFDNRISDETAVCLDQFKKMRWQ
jgi:hypothetical protein